MLLQGSGQASAYCLSEFSSPPQQWSPSPSYSLNLWWLFVWDQWPAVSFCVSLSLSFFGPILRPLGLQQETCTVGLGVGAAGKAHPSFLAVNRGCTCRMAAPCSHIVLLCSRCYLCLLSIRRQWWPGKVWLVLGLSSLSFLTEPHSLFLSAFPCLSLSSPLPRLICSGCPS